MKLYLLISIVLLSLSPAVCAQGKIALQAGDTVQSVLKRHAGEKLELRLKSGDKIAGKVEKVEASVVHISTVTGQEFFDAVVDLSEVSAVLVRTK